MEVENFSQLIRKIIADQGELNQRPLEELLRPVSRIDDLAALPPGTRVIVRADIDVPVKDGFVSDTSRLEACAETLRFCRERGWVTIVFGHLGRKKETSAEPVAKAWNEKFGWRFQFIEEWLNETANRLLDEVVAQIDSARPGDQFLLQNTRRYDIERALWDAKEGRIDAVARQMHALSDDIRRRLAEVFINEAIAASNLDFSSCVLPLLMNRVAFGFYLASEMRDHIVRVRNANFVVFSGLKIDKLDDLEGIIDRGRLRLILAGGSLAMALRKARAELDGVDFCLGLAETDPQYFAYIGRDRIEQGIRILRKCTSNGIRVVLPVDYVLTDLRISSTIPPDAAQLDVGPETCSLIRTTVQQYVDDSSPGWVMFYNGVFGKFEDKHFQAGTREFVSLLKSMTDAGILTFVGGGEGYVALKQFGSLADVTHAFTCGGTVLKSLTDRHIGFVKAMYLHEMMSDAKRIFERSTMMDAIGEFKDCLRPARMEELADLLGGIPELESTQALLERLGSDQVQEDSDVEAAVCDALVKHGVMRRLGNLTYEFLGRSSLSSPVRSILTQQRQTIPAKYRPPVE